MLKTVSKTVLCANRFLFIHRAKNRANRARMNEERGAMRYELGGLKRCPEGDWRVDVRDNLCGRRLKRKITACSDEQAVRRASQIVAELNGCPTLREAAESYVAAAASRVCPVTLAGYEAAARLMAPLLGDRIDAISAKDAQAFVDGLAAEGRSRNVVLKSRNFASAVVEAARVEGRATTNPFAETASPPRPEPAARIPIPAGEAARLVRLVSISTEKAVLAAGVALGCRLAPGEVACVRPTDFSDDFDSLTVRERTTRACKGRAANVRLAVPRTVDVPDWLGRAVSRTLIPMAYLFGSVGPANLAVLSKKVNGMLDSLGFPFKFSDLGRGTMSARGGAQCAMQSIR